MGVLCTWVKLLTNLQIFSCELHKNAFGGRAPLGPAGGAIALPRPPSRYEADGREGRLGIGTGRKGREGKDVKG